MACERVLWDDVHHQARALADRWRGYGIEAVYGVPRGGVVPALLVAQQLGVQLLDDPGVPGDPDPVVLVVDDLVDSGGTARRWTTAGWHFDALYAKAHAPALRYAWAQPTRVPSDAWLVFPWEVGTDDAAGPADAVVRLLAWVGEDPNREGLRDTPQRVLRAYREMTAGYHDDVAAVLGTMFTERSDELVAVTGIEFVSLCEHHLLPFVGTATVGYLPDRRVVGLSKLGRVVDTFARRLQVQERMTHQIAEAVQEHVQPRGVGVVLRAEHSCMSCRGVRKRSQMVTSSMLGAFRDNATLRTEFLALERGTG